MVLISVVVFKTPVVLGCQLFVVLGRHNVERQWGVVVQVREQPPTVDLEQHRSQERTGLAGSAHGAAGVAFK